MCKEKQTIHYCTILSAGQWDFLLEGKSSAFRQKCLYRLMTGCKYQMKNAPHTN